jgi:hypothetical protein
MHAATTALASSNAGASHELVAAASELLFDARSNDDQLRLEFGELAREVALREPSALDPLSDFISTASSQ